MLPDIILNNNILKDTSKVTNTWFITSPPLITVMEDDDDNYQQPLRSESEDEDCPIEFPVSDRTRLLDSSIEESTDSCLPIIDSHPFHFQDISECPTVQESFLVAKLQCLTCNCLRNNFFCFSCINHGEFVSSRSDQVLKEKFYEKQLRLLAVEEEKRRLTESISQLLEPHVIRDSLQVKVNQTQTRISQLKQQLILKQSDLSDLKNKKIDGIQEILKEAKKEDEMRKHKLASTETYLKQLDDRINSKRGDRSKVENHIREDTWDLAVQLRRGIFTLEIYDPDDNEGNSLNNESQPLLGYASLFSSPSQPSSSPSHSQARGRQMQRRIKDVRPETRYTVIEPWIPASSDFSEYTEWVTRFKDSNASFDSVEKRNDAFRVSAALSYVAHMTDVLAGLLDVRLPRRLSFSEFYSKTVNSIEEFLTEKELAFKVAKLNTNIAFLCLSQKLDPNLINVRQPVSNLINLLEPSMDSDLGRRSSIPCELDFLHSLEKHLSQDLQLFKEETFVENNNDYDTELDIEDFENIPNWEVNAFNFQDQQSMSQAQSIFSPTGLLNTAVSWFKQ